MLVFLLLKQYSCLEQHGFFAPNFAILVLSSAFCHHFATSCQATQYDAAK